VTLEADLIARFAWVDGHADVWRLFDDGGLLERLVDALAEPYAGVTKVAGVEARGFILGAAVATRLGAGFVAIRKEGGLLPGPKVVLRTAPDYRGNECFLRLQRRGLDSHDRVLLVDDWAERGSQALAARRLIEECGASFAGLSIVVDQLDDEVRPLLQPLHALISHASLPTA
jgi:adenine phosphoribosyltransferase